MSRSYALLLVSMMLLACGQSPLGASRSVLPPVAATSLITESDSVRGTVQADLTRYLTKKHPGSVIVKLTVERLVHDGQLRFEATCQSPRQLRRIVGHYDVAKRVSNVEDDTLRPY
jgi:hypothetical protein